MKNVYLSIFTSGNKTFWQFEFLLWTACLLPFCTFCCFGTCYMTKLAWNSELSPASALGTVVKGVCHHACPPPSTFSPFLKLAYKAMDFVLEFLYTLCCCWASSLVPLPHHPPLLPLSLREVSPLSCHMYAVIASLFPLRPFSPFSRPFSSPMTRTHIHPMYSTSHKYLKLETVWGHMWCMSFGTYVTSLNNTISRSIHFAPSFMISILFLTE